MAWPAVFGVRPRRGIASTLLVAAFVAHLQIEGLRWQLIPLYLATFGLVIGDIVFLDRELRWPRRVARGVFGVVGLLLVASLGWLLPVPELPTPTGTEVIGTVVVEVIDRDRPEIYGLQPGQETGGDRRFVAQVWYPAGDPGDAEPQGVHPDWPIVGSELALDIGFPGWFLSHVKYTDSHSFDSLPVAPGTYPVVLYSHGWTGYRSIGLNQIESLVSNGYIVIAPDHTYGAVATVFNDGEVVTYDPSALPDETTVSDTQYRESSEMLVETFAGDLLKILDELDLGVEGDFGTLTDSMDLTRVGVFGHSTGGGAAMRVCLVDERCDAVLGMDAWVEPLPDRILAETLQQPSLQMRSAEWQAKPNDAILRGISERSEEVAYWIGIDGTGHNDFVMTPLFSPVADELGLRGPIPAGRIIPIINQYLVGFFDVFLLGTGPAAINTVTFDEVSLEIIPAANVGQDDEAGDSG